MQTVHDYDQGRHERPPQIGACFPRVDASAKVTGQERYASDYSGPPALWAGVKRAGVPHGVLKAVHTERASRVPGVVCVLTHADVPGVNRQGVVRKDQPVLVDDKVRHCGDAVALVAAETEAALESALSLIEVELEPLPGVFDPERARAPRAPRVHDDYPTGSALLSGRITKGLGAEAFGECDVVISRTFRTPRQEHAYLETECGWAQLGRDGRLTITCSTQTPFRDRRETAEVLAVDENLIRIIAPYPGGAFGGKDGVTVQTLLGLAALHANGRPVRMRWDREESFLAGTKRHAAVLEYRLGATREGSFHALEARITVDTGPYDHLGGVVLALAMEHAGGPYRIPNVSIEGWAVYTNNPIGGAFRGFGVTQVTAALEQMVDEVGRAVGMDPVEIRRKNALRVGDTTPVGKTLDSSTGFADCLDRLNGHPSWRRREQWKAEAGPFKKRGVGVAGLAHATGYGPVVPDFAQAKIELTTEGKFVVYCGVVDMGQGNASTNVQIAGAELGQTADAFIIALPDTDRTLPSGSASASRCTYTFGNALIEACRTLKRRLLTRAADLLMAESALDYTMLPGCVADLKTGRRIPLAVLASKLSESERSAVGYFRAPVARDDLGIADDLRLHGIPHQVFSYGVHAAFVEIDELTGEASVHSYIAVSDCGTVMNPETYEQQIQGAVAQGLGYALTEDMIVDQGVIMTPSFFTYLIPTACDTPDIESIPVGIHEPTGPYGLKGVGEIATNGPLPAISNAVVDACGIRITESPLTPERILNALNQGNAKESSF
jgi:CO/xanthine dehydrogenase Mo-binding subunit